MVFLQTAPSTALTNYIHEYWYLATDDPAEFGHLKQIMFPIDFGGLSFYFGDQLPVVEHYANNIRRQVPAIYTGLITTPGSITFQANAPLEGFVTAFAPNGFCDLFQIDASTTTDLLPDFYTLVAEGKQLYAQVKEAKDFESKVAIMNNYFSTKLPDDGNSLFISEAVSKIVQSNGLIDVKQLAYEVNTSLKTLERHFRSRVGVSPKMYARFKRFHCALSLLAAPEPKSWLEIAHMCGYYDQAHFIKEFRKFTNQNPSAFSVMDYPLFYRFIIEKK